MTHPFIKHNGGPCPVSPETRVDVKFPDGGFAYGYVAGVWRGHDGGPDLWEWEGIQARNIIAYRLHQPDEGEAS